ncbi:MAG: DEAD/DEAH box helicase [Phycisphaera sp.]|nr:MAG: DEAD/DEAH box helicase [Phycisphaera sp.]
MVSTAVRRQPACLHAAWVAGRLWLWAEVAPSRDANSSEDTAWIAGEAFVRRVVEALGSKFGEHGEAGEIDLRLPLGGRVPSPAMARAAGVVDRPGGEGSEEDGAGFEKVTIQGVSFGPDHAAAVLDAINDLASGASEVALGEGRFELAASGDTPQAGVLVAPTVRHFIVALALVRQLVIQQRFVPSLRQHPDGRLLGCWQPWLADEHTAKATSALLNAMPLASSAGVDDLEHDPWLVLSDFLTLVLDAQARAAFGREKLVEAVENKEHDTHVAWLSGLLDGAQESGIKPSERTDAARGVRRWLARLEERGASALWRLCLKLHEPVNTEELPDLQPPPGDTKWALTFHLRAVGTENVEVDAEEVWSLTGRGVTVEGRQLDDPQQLMLSELGRASRLFDKLEGALRQSEPTRLELTTKQAYQFLRDTAPVLSEQGITVVAPPWWDSPSIRVGATLRLDSDPMESLTGDAEGWGVAPEDEGVPGAPHTHKSQLGLQTLVRYSWEISLGGLKLTLAEFEKLARDGSTPLVRVGGQWAEVRAEDVKAAAKFIREHPGGEMTVLEAIRMAHGSMDEEGAALPIVGIETSGWLGAVFGSSDESQSLPEVEAPPTFHGELRPYQLRGVAWMAFLERFGFGACLADDMGLGKTIQVLALLARERHLHSQGPYAQAPVPPTLAIVPMSVLGNWEHEARRFCPSLKVMVHHGAERHQDDAFIARAGETDVVLTTYALAHRDQELLARMPWRRIILDEAQNIKNPAAKQAQSVRQLHADHRLALTGTPVENRLSELWSIIDFCNPGYLGTIGNFRRRFSLPIERYSDRGRREQLRRLVRPFILRRLKTDEGVAGDLPEKVESREYCHLTSEQAALYEATVNTMLRDIDRVEGMHRRGMVLSTLIRLKQICNHPSQLLKDHDFGQPGAPDATRSGKCVRLVEMLQEVQASGEQALLFTQFRQMGRLLVSLLQQELGKPVLFLHGGTTQKQRQDLINKFQKADGTTPLLILSLKAGGVGLNLTAATHVFHFDRWWNPAVENQATDRAYRIGQTKRVQVHKFVVRGTLEERIDAMIEQKTELAEQIVGAGERWLTELDTSQLRDLLTLRGDAVGDEEVA